MPGVLGRVSEIPPYIRYVDPWTMRDMVRHAADAKGGRAWMRRGSRGSGKWCCLRERERADRIKPRWTDERVIGELIDALRRHPRLFGKRPAPSSFNWPWMRTFTPPQASLSTIRAVDLEFSIPTQWNEAIQVGSFAGTWSVYDIVSAFAWAGHRPLPDVRETIYCDGKRLGRGRHGLYLVRAKWTAPLLPSRLRTDRPVWVTDEELDHYGAENLEVIRGLEWARSWDLRPHFERMHNVLPADSFKKMCRAYWGAWASTDRVEEWNISKAGPKRTRYLPRRHFCPVWAWMIKARVTIRCAEVFDSVHVFTDSVLTKNPIRSGLGLGEWRLLGTLDRPWVLGAGLYGDDRGPFRHMGISEGDVLPASVYRSRAELAATQREEREHGREEKGRTRSAA